MNLDKPASAEPVVLAEKPGARSGIFGLRRRQAKLSVPKSGTHLFVRTKQADGSDALRRVVSGDVMQSVALDENVTVLHVSTATHPLNLAFSEVLKDQGGHGWDFKVSGSWSVADSRRFLTSYALSIVAPNVSLSGYLVQSWMANTVSHKVRDAVRGNSIEDLRDKDTLPARWWENQFCKWLEDYGIAAKITEVHWSSAEAAAADAERARQKDLERMERAQEQKRQAELREAAAKADYEKEKARIETDLRLSAEEKAHQLQLLEKQHRKELIEAETEIENAQRTAEKAALEHEVTMARLHHDTKAAKNAQVSEEEAERRHQEAMGQLAKMQKALERMAGLPGNLLAQLAGSDPRKAHVVAERLVSPEFGFSPETVAGLGYAVTPQLLVHSLREKAAADRKPVTIYKMDLRTRDIGVAKVKALPINTSLQFEFTTARPGFVTLLNIGTSGAVFLHVPNAYTDPAKASTTVSRSYAIPGSKLLPWDRLRKAGLDYVEIGPPGWEHIAVFVTGEPLIDPCVPARATTAMPFVKLQPEELDELCAKLRAWDAGTWSVGILSFLVG